MSLFTRALAGAGESASGMARTWIKEEGALNLEQERARLDEEKVRLVNQLRVQADRQQTQDQLQAKKNLVDYENSPAVADATAARAGRVKRAESDNARYTLSPGQESYIGGGREASNERETEQEVKDRLIRDGLRLSGSGAKPPKTFGPAELDKILKDDYFKDPSTGAVNHQARGLAREMVSLSVAGGRDPYAARDKVLEAIDAAQSVAGGDAKKLQGEFTKIRAAMGLGGAAATAAPGDQPTVVGRDEARAAERERRFGRTALSPERTELREAEEELESWGFARRKRDPEGFKTAQERVRKARAALAPTDAEIDAASRPAFNFAR